MYKSLITDLLPDIYSQLRTGEHLRSVAPNETDEWRKQWALNHTDVPVISRSFACEGLSLALFHALDTAGVPASREFHVHPFSNQWHFVIRHSIDEPTVDDLITDLNPWSFAPEEKNLPDFLHAKRSDAMQSVVDAGSNIEHAATLRAQCLSVSTIAMSHTEDHSLVNHFLRIQGDEIIKSRAAAGFDFGFTDWRAQSS